LFSSLRLGRTLYQRHGGSEDHIDCRRSRRSLW
jgi:hypothetical protein